MDKRAFVNDVPCEELFQGPTWPTAEGWWPSPMAAPWFNDWRFASPDWSNVGVPMHFKGKGHDMFAGGKKGFKGKGKSKGGLGGKGKSKGKGKVMKGGVKGEFVKGKGKESAVAREIPEPQIVQSPVAGSAPASPSTSTMPGARSRRRNHVARQPQIRSIKRLAKCVAEDDFSSLPTQGDGQPYTWFSVGLIGNFDSGEWPLLSQFVVKNMEVEAKATTGGEEKVETVKVENAVIAESVITTEVKPVESAVVPVPKPEVKPVEIAAPVSKPEVKPVEIVEPVAKPEEIEAVSTSTSSQSDNKTENKFENSSVAASTPRKKKRKTVDPIRLADFVPQVPGAVSQAETQGPQKVDTDDI